MFVKISKPPIGNNKSTCSALANYLDKEDRTTFFDSDGNNIERLDVINAIDNNTTRLNMDDAKFYMIAISPSQKELEHLVGGKVDSYEDLSIKEKIELTDKLQSYTHDVMDSYAKNFNRDNVNSGKDLLYYGRVEIDRNYKHTDEEVRNGNKKAGDLKEGLNVHVHVIVSRKSKDGSAKLSPNGRFRGASWEVDGRTVSRGFNHTNWKSECINKFNEKYNYQYNSNDGWKANEKSSNMNLSNSNVDKGLGKKVFYEVTKGQLQAEKQIYAKAKQTASTILTAASFIKNPVGTATHVVLSQAKKLATGLLNQSQKI